ncbi:MAG: MFS transporter, partial [Chlamydiia bacterium]|nr:MFS transporter [Chlamydiia bacterium]
MKELEHPHTDRTKLKVKKPSLWILIILISYGSMGAALFTPALPALMDDFNIGASVSQLTVMLYLVGYGLGQLIYSPLAKALGRKPTLTIGVTISIFGAMLCLIAAFVHTFPLLSLARFISSLGASVGLSLTFLIISDFYHEQHARKITAYIMLSFAVIPGVAIALGGLFVSYFGWESCFYFLILYGLFTLYLITRLDETGSGKEKGAAKLQVIVSAYRRDFKNNLLVSCSVMIGMTTAIIYIFAATAPIIFIKMMGHSAALFGLMNLIPAAGYFAGNFVAARLSHYFAIETVLKAGIVLMGIGAALFALLIFSGMRGPLSIFIPVAVIYFGIPLLYSNAAVLATFRVVDKPNASSIMSFLNISGAVIGLILIELIHGNPLIVVPLVFLLLVATIFLLFLFG